LTQGSSSSYDARGESGTRFHTIKHKHNRTAQREYSIKAIQRGLDILEALLEARSPLSLEHICARTGLPKSTAFRIVSNLIQRQYLIEGGEGYWLGFKPLQLGALVEEKLDLKHQALPFLRQLVDRFGETVHLAVLDEDFRVLYVEKLTAERAVGVMISRVGLTAPMHCTALGKVMAAFKPEDEIRRWILASGLKAYTDATITEEKSFLRELSEIRCRGYAIDNVEHELGVRCIAAPILDKSGAVIAALSIAGPDTRMPAPLIGSPMAMQIVETGRRISRVFGYSGQPNRAPNQQPPTTPAHASSLGAWSGTGANPRAVSSNTRFGSAEHSARAAGEQQTVHARGEKTSSTPQHERLDLENRSVKAGSGGDCRW
jgi:IclR family transcriptional regulator, KDG regulon repressor